MNKTLKRKVMKVIKKPFFRIFCICCQDTKITVYSHIICTLSPQGISWHSLGPVGLNKMSDLFKNVSWYITQEICAALLHMLKHIPEVQKRYYEEVARMCEKAVWMHSGREKFRTPCGLLLPYLQYSFLSLSILRRRRCVKKQLKKIHGG